jgi:hypothetical protein
MFNGHCGELFIIDFITSVLSRFKDSLFAEASGAICRKRLSQLARGVLLHSDNARPLIAQATHERIQELQWELLEHLPSSPGLAPSDFHLFGSLKCLRQESKDFYAAGFNAVVK